MLLLREAQREVWRELLIANDTGLVADMFGLLYARPWASGRDCLNRLTIQVFADD